MCKPLHCILLGNLDSCDSLKLSFLISKIHHNNIYLAGLLGRLNEIMFVKTYGKQLTTVHIEGL